MAEFIDLVEELGVFGVDDAVDVGLGEVAGALPVEGGVAVAFGRDIAQAPDPEARRSELEARFASSRNPFRAAESFAVHEMIDPRETRPMLCDWIEWIQPRLEGLVGETRFLMRP